MNIKKAKEQIKNAVRAYFTKDEFGNYIIPTERQRPVFLMGPPGIGKTAVMEQIASEMGVGLLSYSMTHHTRQSSLGLPFIVHKNYRGEEFDISEYTMSEIIAAVYDLMESSGINEGILFLDEINCVSETLAPIMLRFLQYKTFGRYKVPDGWIVVTAGNPPEYNNSVREFDIVTWDRLKRIDVEPDFEVWKEYAYRSGVHAAVTTYLEIRKGDFYKVETTAGGRNFITARGWDDLSQMILLYERNDIPVDEDLIVQYINDKSAAKSFAVYYDLFNKYKSDYRIEEILSGNASDEIIRRAKAAHFDERLSLSGLILDVLTSDSKSVILGEQFVRSLLEILKEFKERAAVKNDHPDEIMRGLIEKQREILDKGRKAGSVSRQSELSASKLIKTLEEAEIICMGKNSSDAFSAVREFYDGTVRTQKKMTADTGRKFSNAFGFFDSAFPGGQETLVFVTELTAGYYTSKFISRFGCREYFEHNRELLFYERQKEILAELDELGEL